jgi:hypothetical protein
LRSPDLEDRSECTETLIVQPVLSSFPYTRYDHRRLFAAPGKLYPDGRGRAPLVVVVRNRSRGCVGCVGCVPPKAMWERLRDVVAAERLL